jgi:hypothetical protein
MGEGFRLRPASGSGDYPGRDALAKLCVRTTPPPSPLAGRARAILRANHAPVSHC